jgi:hypothetical protein
MPAWRSADKDQHALLDLSRAHRRRIPLLAKGLRIVDSGEGLIEDFQCTEIILGAPWVKRV